MNISQMDKYISNGYPVEKYNNTYILLRLGVLISIILDKGYIKKVANHKLSRA